MTNERTWYRPAVTEPKNKPGFYHWSDILGIQMAYDEDGDGHLEVVVKPEAVPSEKASGMMWMWLRVSERGTAVKHPDATNQDHCEYVDEFDDFKLQETKKALRKQRQMITDPLLIRVILTGNMAEDDRVQFLTTGPINNLTAALAFGISAQQTWQATRDNRK